MLNIFKYLRRPEYLFRPRQVLRRIRRIWRPVRAEELVELPWGAQVTVRPNENIGSEIYYYGIFDRVVPEAIYRLADKNELSLDVGANIGQNCSLMAFRACSGGRVIAFEPHPEIFGELKANAGRWPEKIRRNLQLENFALGEIAGETWLTNGSEFEHNRGSATLCDSTSPNSRAFKVNLRQLDDYIRETETVGVCKIDVEGHELSVLKGATRALRRKAIRDIIFEDFSQMLSPTAQFLQKHGFTIFQLIPSWWRPVLAEVLSEGKPKKDFSCNYLATLDPQRAATRFIAGGWHCLTGRHAP
jgi:FkbM family methyltransferase